MSAASSNNNRTTASAPPCTSQVLASSIRVAASPPAPLRQSQESQASGVTGTIRRGPTGTWVENYWGA